MFYSKKLDRANPFCSRTVRIATSRTTAIGMLASGINAPINTESFAAYKIAAELLRTDTHLSEFNRNYELGGQYGCNFLRLALHIHRHCIGRRASRHSSAEHFLTTSRNQEDRRHVSITITAGHGSPMRSGSNLSFMRLPVRR